MQRTSNKNNRATGPGHSASEEPQALSADDVVERLSSDEAATEDEAVWPFPDSYEALIGWDTADETVEAPSEQTAQDPAAGSPAPDPTFEAESMPASSTEVTEAETSWTFPFEHLIPGGAATGDQNSPPLEPRSEAPAAPTHSTSEDESAVQSTPEQPTLTHAPHVTSADPGIPHGVEQDDRAGTSVNEDAWRSSNAFESLIRNETTRSEEGPEFATAASKPAARNVEVALPVPGRVGVRRPAGKKAEPESEGGAPRERKLLYPLLVLFGIPLTLTMIGLPYYVLPIAERLRSPLHPWFKSTGLIGQAAGWVALTMFVFLWLYPLRKRFRWLAWSGPIFEWFHFHLLAGLAILPLVAIHASWRFHGLIGFGFYSMVLVVLSGVVGRYIYVRIPRGKSGLELDREQLAKQRQGLVRKISAATGLSPEELERMLMTGHGGDGPKGVGRTLLRMLTNDLDRWKLERAFKSRLRNRPGARAGLDRRTLRETRELARREILLTQQVEMLEATQRVFAYWHVVHRPVSVTALVVVLIHVVVAMVVGMTWLK